MAKRTGRLKREGKKNKTSFFSIVGKPLFYGFLLLLIGTFFLISIPKKFIKIVNRFSKKIRLPKKFLRLPKISLPNIRLPKLKLHRPSLKISINFIGFLLGIFISSSVIFFFVFYILIDLPSPKDLGQKDSTLTTKIYDSSGKILYKIYREKNRTFIPLAQLPTSFIHATISIEDKDFYRHQGLSWRGILRSIYLDIVDGKRVGGSTITQQLVKNTLLSSEKTWQRKIKEAVLAVLVEKKFSKNEILEIYVNTVSYGGNTYGIEEASQKYFKKSARDLTFAEAALIAGLPVSPTLYSPFGNHPELAKQRQNLVLKNMVEEGYLTAEESEKIEKEQINFTEPKEEISAPHFVMFIKEQLAQKYGEKLLEEGGLEITTSIDLDIQTAAQKIVKEEVEKLSNLHITNAAALVTNPRTGEILAMVGSKNYFAKDIDGNVNVTTSLRQPGSSIKPVNYSIALENGFTPATLIEDSPITYNVPGQPPYSPENYDRQFHGQVPLRIALGSSYNIPAVKILAAFGVKKMIQRGREMGITNWTDPSRYGLSLTLGGGEVKMTDMAVVYGVLANNGIRVDLNPILEIKDSKGKILEKNRFGKESPILNPGIAFLLTNILSDNTARTPAFGLNSQLNIPNRPVAVKTGTTQNMRDNWTIGYTPSLLTAVWVGNNDNSPMSYVASGVTGASPIWRKIMDKLLEGKPVETFIQPEEIKTINICQTTNTLPCNGCPNIKTEYFISGTEPRFACDPEKWNITPEVKPTLFPQIL